MSDDSLRPPESSLGAGTDRNGHGEAVDGAFARGKPEGVTADASGPPESGVDVGTDNATADEGTKGTLARGKPQSVTADASGPPESSVDVGTDSAAADEGANGAFARVGPEGVTGDASGPPKSSLGAGTDRNESGEGADGRLGRGEPERVAVAASGPPESSLDVGTDKSGGQQRTSGPFARFQPREGGRLARVIDRVQPPQEEDFRSPVHHERVTARIGVWLGISFLLCFLTGLLSHLIQHPPGWFWWPSTPAGLYQVTQGVHVTSGVAAVPLLFAKLWSVYPKLFGRPLIRSLPHALERVSILVLSGAAFFELATGLFNVAQNYPYGFYFPAAHYAVAWLAAGSVLLHVAVKLPVVRRALTREPETAEPSRRAFLRSTWLATGAAVVVTAGGTVPLLRNISVLSWKSNNGPQGVPVNRTAGAARVVDAAQDSRWRLEVVTRHGVTRLSLAQLKDLPQRTADLPIACVEGWSQYATWSGVSIAELVRLVGGTPGGDVRVESLEKRGAYRVSTLPGTHTANEDTLLALRLNGEALDLDHGFPCRIIAPSRPGVLQTKWVHRLEVL